MAEIPRNLVFDQGIERVLPRVETTAPRLPEAAEVDPGVGRAERQLDDVLFPPSLEQSLVEALRPEISQREILTPVGYEAALAETAQQLEQAARENADTTQRERLQQASDLLQDEMELRELLRTYRHLLHQA